MEVRDSLKNEIELLEKQMIVKNEENLVKAQEHIEQLRINNILKGDLK